RLERIGIDFIARVEIDRASRIAFEAGVEQLRRILQRRALGEGQFHVALVALAGADESVVRPHRNVPLPFLDDVGICLLDDGAQTGERLAAPVVQFLDPGVDLFRGRLALSWILVHAAACISLFFALRPLAVYGSTNMYRPVKSRKARGGSGE